MCVIKTLLVYYFLQFLYSKIQSLGSGHYYEHQKFVRWAGWTPKTRHFCQSQIASTLPRLSPLKIMLQKLLFHTSWIRFEQSQTWSAATQGQKSQSLARSQQPCQLERSPEARSRLHIQHTKRRDHRPWSYRSWTMMQLGRLRTETTFLAESCQHSFLTIQVGYGERA